MLRTLLIAVVAVAAISIPAGAAGEPNVTLTAVVGPGFNISLKNPDGTGVSHLDPGTYTIAVTDNAIDHNFHLMGAGVEQATDVEGTGSTTWTVTFADGNIYNYRCDAHPTQMKGSFGVGNVPPPPPPPPPAGKLSGKVTARTISLKKGSSKVKTLTAGKFKLAVSDTAKTQNFHLKGPGVNKKTGVAARSKATWTLTLKVGKYTYRSDKSRTLHGSFTVKAAS